MKSKIRNNFDQIKNNTIFSSFLNLSGIQASNVLLLVLLHPILNRKIGDAYGMTMVSNSFALLLGIIVNYGTNQSGIKDIALSKNEPNKLGSEFYSVILVRLLIFLALIPVILITASLNNENYLFFLLVTPLIFAEILNPLFLFIGLEKLSIFNVFNVLIKIGIILSVLFFINNPNDAAWVNFYMGIIHAAGYLILYIYASNKFKLPLKKIGHLNYKKLLKNNFYLVSNGLSVHLQQSFMLFALAKWGSSGWLYAYSVGDKIIWSIRLLIVSVTNAIYPKSAIVYQESKAAFLEMKNKYNQLLGIAFGLISLGLFLFAPLIIKLYTGTENTNSVLILRLMSLSPLLASINTLNVVHLLISEQNKQILKIGICLLFTSFCISASVIYTMNIYYLGLYAVIIEAIALLYYTRVLKQKPN